MSLFPVMILLALGGAAGCTKNQDGAATSTSAPASKRHEARGVIKAFTEGRKAVNIAHEDIPDFMKAMTMPFEVTSPSLLEGLKEGDAVDFSFTEESGGRFVIQGIKKR